MTGSDNDLITFVQRDISVLFKKKANYFKENVERKEKVNKKALSSKTEDILYITLSSNK